MMGNLFLDEKETNLKFNNEKEFQKHIYDYFINQGIQKIKMEKFCKRQVRPDIFFEYENKTYIVECKYLIRNTNHAIMSGCLDQMFRYKKYFGNNVIYLIAIYSDKDKINYRWGDRGIFPLAQVFAGFEFYFLKWCGEFPKYHSNQIEVFSYWNGKKNINV